MSVRKIQIEIDAGDENCGQCPYEVDLPDSFYCQVFGEPLPHAEDDCNRSLRCPECLAAEKAATKWDGLADVIAATRKVG
jgi:hypothetical protein